MSIGIVLVQVMFKELCQWDFMGNISNISRRHNLTHISVFNSAQYVFFKQDIHVHTQSYEKLPNHYLMYMIFSWFKGKLLEDLSPEFSDKCIQGFDSQHIIL